jgi:ectoine hydroxylase-related dioxygenase (phytanoyl-CoA dioxygenase family)
MVHHAATALHTSTSLRTPRRRALLSLSATTMSVPDAFSGSFDSHQMDALVKRGELEAKLMQASHLGALGDESNEKKKKKKKAPSTSMMARTLKQDGVVLLKDALSVSSAATLREEIIERRSKAYAAVNDGEDWRLYFADVLLKSSRCDLLLPLNKGMQRALQELLKNSKLANVLVSTIGEDATLYELSALISEPGAPRQPVHPDNPHQENPPLLTCFVALQDISASMGPTTFLPKTHTAAAHAEFDDHVNQRDSMLEIRPNVVALLKAGDVALFDSRTMHCGGANDINLGSSRAVLYLSFRNPRATEPIGNVGSLMPGIQKMTLRELRTNL